jgi:ABC-type dipeptide/oligopeptide/nickel transport systems, permease components
MISDEEREYNFQKAERNGENRRLAAYAAGAAALLIVLKILLINRWTIPAWGLRLAALGFYLFLWYVLGELVYRRWGRINYPDKLNPLKRFMGRFYKNKLATLGLFIVLAVAVMAIFASDIAIYPYEYDPTWQEFSEMPPSREHPFGTLASGEDLFSAIVYGSRISLYLGVGVTLISSIIGLLLGVTAGYYGGTTDRILQYLNDVVMAFPFLVLILALVGILTANEALREGFIFLSHIMGLDVRLTVAFICMAFLFWTSIYRIVRSKVLSIRELGYIESAKACGAKSRTILWRHLVPNVIPAVIIIATLGVGSVILTESGLSYLGMGAEIGTPSWGRLLSDTQGYVSQLRYFSLVFFPGLAIFFTVLGFTTMGDGLRDAIDPRMKT